MLRRGFCCKSMWGVNSNHTTGSARRAYHKCSAIVLKTSSPDPRCMLLVPGAKRSVIRPASAGRPGSTISIMHGRDGIQLRLVETAASIPFLTYRMEPGLGLRQFLSNASEVCYRVECSHFNIIFYIERLPNFTAPRLRPQCDSTTLATSTAKWNLPLPQAPPNTHNKCVLVGGR